MTGAPLTAKDWQPSSTSWTTETAELLRISSGVIGRVRTARRAISRRWLSRRGFGVKACASFLLVLSSCRGGAEALVFTDGVGLGLGRARTATEEERLRMSLRNRPAPGVRSTEEGMERWAPLPVQTGDEATGGGLSPAAFGVGIGVVALAARLSHMSLQASKVVKDSRHPTARQQLTGCA